MGAQNVVDRNGQQSAIDGRMRHNRIATCQADITLLIDFHEAAIKAGKGQPMTYSCSFVSTVLVWSSLAREVGITAMALVTAPGW